ncbi:MAG: PmoA family protein [Chthoniobacteraceae bacterium]
MKPLIVLAIAATSVFAEPLSVIEKADRLVITHGGKPVADFVFEDDRVLRPFFANVHAPGGMQVTRRHPPVAGEDSIDHDTMHPGIWLAFGDLGGEDFWRNKATIRHERFVAPPAVKGDVLSFATESTMGDAMAKLETHITLSARAEGFVLVWDATLTPTRDGVYFGDQEEMGFGVRLATALTEKSGGTITNSAGAKTAKATWGQSAAWCDYSGTIDGRHAGVTIIPDPKNFRASWWHARDYGLLVANPFGQKAMKQGAASRIEVKRGESFHLRFAALIHSSAQPPNLAEACARLAETDMNRREQR